MKHREIAKKLAPAFSMRNFKAKETAVHNHIDLFVQRMQDVGAGEEGAELQRWTDWLALDLSAEMTYGLAMNQMRDSKRLQRLQHVMLLTWNSEGLDSPQRNSKAESLLDDEPNHEEVPPT